MKFAIPAPLKAEHDELHETLRRATREPGDLGEAAKRVAKLMHPHFVKEEAFALPPLGLLNDVVHGRVTKSMKDVLAMTDQLKIELPAMLLEHKRIVAALEKLIAAAKNSNQPKYEEFATRLIQHAQSEELIAYPAAILVGEYIKAKLHLVQP